MSEQAPIGYEEIIDGIQSAPVTQLPAILQKAITACVVRKVFTTDGLMQFCNGAYERALNVKAKLETKGGGDGE